MADPTAFELLTPSTWIPSILAGAAGVYTAVRILKRDKRNDLQEKQIDAATQQIITNLRQEVDRLTERMGQMEEEIVRLHKERAVYHEERAQILVRLAEYEAERQQQLNL